ncbi:UDP-2,4-diacetamido-2,4,6-trideoxy-beta-L-altropyranose hydrolase [Paenibacillus sp. M1]|uniref:UDP-2,4-diacetamido-2,4, 6-trideoxy-beta-L-altropyranose hydrolase n=1 Tax=Paenibacillus haidiansis TaxID=1574488 RepID=A0ABU7VWL8_9BACL
MNIVFRVDATYDLGIGHVMRCLTLAQHLTQHISSLNISFVCSEELPNSMHGKIVEKGYALHLIGLSNVGQHSDAEQFLKVIEPMEVDWVITDHYSLDITWETLVRPFTRGIIIIDDLANRRHDCDVIIDQNLYANLEKRYRSLIPEHCIPMLGPNYSLIREEFFEVADQIQERDECKNILVSFGGSDPTDELGKVLSALEKDVLQLKKFNFHVVAGPANPRQSQLQELCKNIPNVCFYPQVNQMAKFLLNMDLAIGAGGISLWERCFMGVPSIVIIVADNQEEAVLEAAKKGLAWNLGFSSKVSSSDITEVLIRVALTPEELKVKSSQAIAFMSNLKTRRAHPITSIIERYSSDGSYK